MTPLLRTAQTWVCASGCDQRYESDRILPNRFHTCPKLRMMTAPMVLEGTSAKVSLVEREDYVGREKVTLDPERGRPVMAIRTERPDGSNDVAVFVPAAAGFDRR